MNKSLRIVLSVALSLLVLSASADGKKDIFNPVNASVTSQTIAPDARAAGMGDVGVATDADVVSQYWNPAKYPFAISRAGVALNYTPWLRQLVSDMDLAYLAGYYRIGDYSAVSGSLRYFSLGEVFMNEQDATNTNGPASAFAADIAAYYQNYVNLGNRECQLGLGLNISNIGSKISFDGGSTNEFIPTNLRLGASLMIPIDEYNRFTIAADANKLLVPTYPTEDQYKEAPDKDKYLDYRDYVQKKYYDRSSISGIFKSFSDAPGGFKEEMQEVQWSIGGEYVYNDKFTVRAGYHNESANKGNRKYFTVGAGFKMSVFSLDAGYVIATAKSNPLDQTLRFTLSFDMDGIKDLFRRR